MLLILPPRDGDAEAHQTKRRHQTRALSHTDLRVLIAGGEIVGFEDDCRPRPHPARVNGIVCPRRSRRRLFQSSRPSHLRASECVQRSAGFRLNRARLTGDAGPRENRPAERRLLFTLQDHARKEVRVARILFETIPEGRPPTNCFSRSWRSSWLLCIPRSGVVCSLNAAPDAAIATLCSSAVVLTDSANLNQHDTRHIRRQPVSVRGYPGCRRSVTP